MKLSSLLVVATILVTMVWLSTTSPPFTAAKRVVARNTNRHQESSSSSSSFEGKPNFPANAGSPVVAPEALEPIDRKTVLQRANIWWENHVPYSQEKYYQPPPPGFRTDCSGYVSMSWNLPFSYDTRTLHEVSYPLSSKDDLLPGDAVLCPGFHVILFDRWADDDHTHYWAYEEVHTKLGTTYHVLPYPWWGPDVQPNCQDEWIPIRYLKIHNDTLLPKEP